MKKIRGRWQVSKWFLALLLWGCSTAVTSAAREMDRETLLFSTYLGGQLADSGTAVATDGMGYIYLTGSTQSPQFPSKAFPRALNHGVDMYVARISPNGRQLDYVLWFNALSAADVDEGYAIFVDDQGHSYVTGHTRSADFCRLYGVVPGYDQQYNGQSDAFLLKVKADGSGLEYCTFLGGSDWDVGTGVVVDDEGYAYLTGSTWSADFPAHAGSPPLSPKGQRDIFIAKIDPSGTILEHSTIIGGSGQEESQAVALDAQQQAVITGWTNSENFPTSAGSYDRTFNGEFDAFLIRYNFGEGTLSYGTFLGSSVDDRASDLVIGQNGLVTLTGTVKQTANEQFPIFPTTTGSYTAHFQGSSDSFVTQFNLDGSGLAFSTLLGGSDQDQGEGIAIDERGRIIITGSTNSVDFPATAQGYQPRLGGDIDAFVAQFNTDGTRLLYGSYLGGGEKDSGLDLVLTANGQAVVTGQTRSPNFPTTPATIAPTPKGDYDAFVAVLDLPPPARFTLSFPLVLGRD